MPVQRTSLSNERQKLSNHQRAHSRGFHNQYQRRRHRQTGKGEGRVRLGKDCCNGREKNPRAAAVGKKRRKRYHVKLPGRIHGKKTEPQAARPPEGEDGAEPIPVLRGKERAEKVI